MRTLTLPNGKKLQRNKKYGVGKQIANDLYFHKKYLDSFDFAPAVKQKISLLPSDFTFNIIRFNLKNKDCSFMDSPDFDSSFHPIIKASFKINSDNTSNQKIPKITGENPPIYHHRWLFVKDDYNGFNVDVDFKYSQLWSQTPNLISNKYGFLRHWEETSIPKILKFYQVKSLEHLIISKGGEK